MSGEKNDARERGIEAIIYLQGAAGITETREQAESGWDAMSEADRENTMVAYEMFRTPIPKAE